MRPRNAAPRTTLPPDDGAPGTALPPADGAPGPTLPPAVGAPGPTLPPADGAPGPTLPANVGDGRLGRVERIIEVLRVLEGERKITKARLYDLLGVTSQSSFKRVKAELTRAGLPLTYDRNDGHFHIPEAASVARYGIDARTRAQLAQVRAAVTALGGPAYDALEDVLAVLEARVALDDPEAIAVVTSRHPQPRADAKYWAMLDRAVTAVREHRWLSFDYIHTMGGESDARTLQPYAVHAHDARYYVWGILEGEISAKLFALDRMRDVVIEADRFEPVAGLSLDDALRHSFGTMIGDAPAQSIVVRFEPTVAAFVSCRRWPGEVGIDAAADGRVRLRFELTRIDEIVAWVLSFGGTATIESPVSARTALRDAAYRIVNDCDPTRAH